MKTRALVLASVLLAGFGVAGCNPTVRVEAPKEPIRIIADINIKHEIKIKIERELDELLTEESGLF